MQLIFQIEVMFLIQQNEHISLIKTKKKIGHWLKSGIFSRNNGSFAVILYVQSVVWWTKLQLNLVNPSYLYTEDEL